MQTEASGHWPAGPPRKGAATCWAPPSPAAPPSPTSLPCRSGLGASCSCRLLPFPGPALAMVLTAGSWGDTDGPAACPSPPFPGTRLATLTGLGWLAKLQEGAGLRCSQGIGDTVTGSPQIPQAAFPVKATAACGETQQGGQAMMNAPAPPPPSRVRGHPSLALALLSVPRRRPLSVRPSLLSERSQARSPGRSALGQDD